MNTIETYNSSLLNDISELIHQKSYTLAEEKLNSMSNQNSEWHFLYSFILLGRAWFDSAKEHLELAINLEPQNTKYQEALAELSHRHNHYSNDYYREPYRRRHNSCCCCCDCCDCDISCCDLICLDSCCECMGGDLIDCI
ncbi:MAG: molecular chaperone DnaJ [Cellulosilyticaceae bacterium]